MLFVDVRSRVEPELMREAAAILKASGLNVSAAIRLFLRSVVEKGGLPMELPRANPVTLAAIRDAKMGKTTGTTLEEIAQFKPDKKRIKGSCRYDWNRMRTSSKN